jgi:uncharacterized coiled-coil DUF342 family protein
MAIIKQYHKDTDTTYVYESTSYWDPELKQARSQRKCIGKIDPETGEMIPTGKRGRKNTASEEKNSNEDYSKLLASYEDVKKENLTLNTRIASLEKELSDTSKELNRYRNTLNKVNEHIMHAAD